MRAPVAICLLAAAIVGAGCASAPRHTAGTKPQRASESKPYDFRSEGKVPAADNTPVEVDVEEIPLSGESLDVSEADVPPAPPADTARTVAPDSTASGFRIQIFASTDREVAEGAARTAEQRVSLRAYTDLEDGMYKVRVGDYLSRGDAEAALGTFRSHYYPDAWIVPARVRVPRGGPSGGS